MNYSDQPAPYVRSYPCAQCTRCDKDEIINGHAKSAHHMPLGFFCSDSCVEAYKIAHPNWKREREAHLLSCEYGCWMRQVTDKDQWDRFEAVYDPTTDKYLRAGSLYTDDQIRAMIEGYKGIAAKKTADWLCSPNRSKK